MNETSWPVTVCVQQPDGSATQVCIGTAVPSGDGFEVTVGGVTIRAAASKGSPGIQGCIEDLEYYASRARKNLADPSKARWHESERALLKAFEEELTRQRGHN